MKSIQQYGTHVRVEKMGMVSRLLRRTERVSETLHRDPGLITTIGVVTKDRPRLLARCLESYLASAISAGRTPQICVVDDSSSERIAAKNLAAMRAAKAAYGVKLLYVGSEERRRFADDLRRVASSEVLQFGLCGIGAAQPSTGASRNCLMLATVDESILSVDDDTFFAVDETVAYRLAPNGVVRLISGASVLEYDLPTQLHGPVSAPEDILSTHERLLGHPVDDFDHCRESFGFGHAISHSSPGAKDLLSRQSVVNLVFSSILGNPGTHSSLPLLRMRGSSRIRLLQSRRHYRDVLASGTLLRYVSQPVVTDNPWCMTTAYSVNHRAALPPFLPAFRNQDGLFGTMCRYCFSDTWFGHVPSVVMHRPPGNAKPRHFLVGATSFRFTDLLLSCIPRAHLMRGSSCEYGGLISLGKHYQKLSQWPDGELRAHLINCARALFSDELQIWSESLAAYRGLPRFWARDVFAILAALERKRAQVDCWVPEELAWYAYREAKLGAIRSLLAKFGLLLECWPAIVGSARELKNRGIVLPCAPS